MTRCTASSKLLLNHDTFGILLCSYCMTSALFFQIFFQSSKKQRINVMIHLLFPAYEDEDGGNFTFSS